MDEICEATKDVLRNKHPRLLYTMWYGGICMYSWNFRLVYIDGCTANRCLLHTEGLNNGQRGMKIEIRENMYDAIGTASTQNLDEPTTNARNSPAAPVLG